MKLVLQLTVALLEALQGSALCVNICPLLEREHTVRGGRKGGTTERESNKKNTLAQIHAMQKASDVRGHNSGYARGETWGIYGVYNTVKSIPSD